MEPPWLQPVATVGNRPCADSPGTSEKRCRALRPVAVWIAMVKSAFATACHRLREGPLCEGGSQFPRSANAKSFEPEWSRRNVRPRMTRMGQLGAGGEP